MTETYDRFTGERAIQVKPRTVVAHHKDRAGEWALLEVGWTVQADEGKPAEHRLEISSSGPVRRWTDSVRVYFLFDGARTSVDTPVALVDDGKQGQERIAMRFDAPLAERLSAASRVELRAADWQFELSSEFRADVVVALATSKVVAEGR